MVYLVARFWGALLPYLAELGIAADGHAGMRTALLYLANILGAAAGSIVTGFVLIDRLGLVATGAALVVAGLACALLLIGAVRMPRSEKILRASLAVTLSLLAMVAIPSWSGNVLDRLQLISTPYIPLVQAVENPSRWKDTGRSSHICSHPFIPADAGNQPLPPAEKAFYEATGFPLARE